MSLKKINDHETIYAKESDEMVTKEDKIISKDIEEAVLQEDQLTEEIHSSPVKQNVTEAVPGESISNVAIDTCSEYKDQATEITEAKDNSPEDTEVKVESSEEIETKVESTEEIEAKFESTGDIELKDESSEDIDCGSLTGNRESITVMRSMIHNTDSIDSIDLDDSVSDLANSSEEAVPNLITSPRKQKSQFNLSLSPKKSNTEDQDDDSSFTVGSHVEAKDFEDIWHPALILEVDSDEMEVLVHYDSAQRNDEWISVSSSRIRAYTQPLPATLPPTFAMSPIRTMGPDMGIKIPLEYKVGERCYARWSDNRRFPATVRSVIGNGKYEIIFDDGICRICQWYCLSKMKKTLPVGNDNFSGSSSATSIASRNVANSSSSVVPIVPFHRHLFDPRLDYLGSKSERRQMKKKLDVKALFNIGKKSYKRKTAPAEGVPPVKKKRVKTKKNDLYVASDLAEIAKSLSAATDAVEVEEKEKMKQDNESNIEPTVPDIKIENINVKPELVQNYSINISQMRRTSRNRKSISTTEEPLNEEIETYIPANDLKNENETVDMDSTNCPENIKDDLFSIDKLPQEYSKGDHKYTAQVIETTASPNADSPLKDESELHIDEGLKLIAEAVESFRTECASQSEAESHEPVHEDPKIIEAAPEHCEATLPEGEWCCRWVDGEPQGVVCELDDSPSKGDRNALPRKSVLVEDKRLPPGWQKMMVRRCFGNSAGKWDIILIDPNNRRLRDKGEMRNYLSLGDLADLKPYEDVLTDFAVHRKLARRLGWDITTSDGDRPSLSLVTSPSGSSQAKKILWVQKNKAVTPESGGTPPKKKRPAPLTPSTPELPAPSPTVATPAQATTQTPLANVIETSTPPVTPAPPLTPLTPMYDGLPYIDGHVYVGSLKVQIIENLFRCPADKCFKNFRKNNLLRMHIKHYHRELRKFLGATPKVSDLAAARTAIPENTVIPKLKCESETKLPKSKSTPKITTDRADKKDPLSLELFVDTNQNAPTTPIKGETDKQAMLQDSPKLRNALESQPPTKRPKVLYPVKKEVKSEHSSPRPDEVQFSKTDCKPDNDMNAFVKIQKLPENMETHRKQQPLQFCEQLDFEAAISTHTVTKPTFWKRKQKSPKKTKREKGEVKAKKKRKLPLSKWIPTEPERWEPSNTDSASSYGTVDPLSSELPSHPATPLVTATPIPDPDYMISETGERIKIEHMKREEIINCHCGFSEEDGLMIQCDLCLCWQHAICHNYNTDTVPDKYTCSICLNPRRGRASRRFLHDQAWLYEGELPGGASDAALRRAHELTGNLLRLAHVVHTLRLKFQVATKKDHPKLYLWAKDWETCTQQGENPDRALAEPLQQVDLNDMFREIGKENLPLKEESSVDKTPPTEDSDSQRDEGPLGSQALLANLLSSPNGTALDLPISTSELERLAKSVQEAEVLHAGGPEPEAAIESGACRKNLLRHIQRLQALIDARLDSIEAQVAELESQEQSFEDDETPEYFPRTKQTLQMLNRDLDTLEELAIIT